MRMEKSLLDKFVNGAFLGKRKIGRPVKYHTRHRGLAGYVELYFNPTTRFERAVSTTMRFIHPYLFYFTYKFHAEQARDVGKSRFTQCSIYFERHFPILLICTNLLAVCLLCTRETIASADWYNTAHEATSGPC